MQKEDDYFCFEKKKYDVAVFVPHQVATAMQIWG